MIVKLNNQQQTFSTFGNETTIHQALIIRGKYLLLSKNASSIILYIVHGFGYQGPKIFQPVLFALCPLVAVFRGCSGTFLKFCEPSGILFVLFLKLCELYCDSLNQKK